MKKYLIAGLKIELNYQYDEYFKNNLEKYAYDGNDIEHKINVFFKDVLDEPSNPNHHVFSKSVSGYKSYMYFDEDFKNIDLWIDVDAFANTAVAEYIYTGMIFMFLAQRRGLIAVQGTAITYKKDIILFVAPSGTGKTTHATMWKEVFNDDVEFLTDLKPLLIVHDNQVIVYPSPFSELNTNPFDINNLKAIIYLTRGVNNSIRKVDVKESVKLFSQNTIKPVDQSIKDLKGKIESIVSLVDAYEYSVSLNQNAPVIVKEAIYNK